MPRTRSTAPYLLMLLMCAAHGAVAQQVSPDINAPYRDPKLRIEEWVERLEGEGREAFDLRYRIVEAMRLRPGQSVADVGAGTGLFAPLLAAAVGPGGKVYAIDIVPKFVTHIEARAKERGLTQVQAVLGAEDSIRLPAASVDVVFVCDAYHHFENPQAMLASIREALRPGGQLYVVDFDRVEGRSEPFVLEHIRASKEEFTAEIEAAGFRFVEELDIEGMRQSFMRRFERR